MYLSSSSSSSSRKIRSHKKPRTIHFLSCCFRRSRMHHQRNNNILRQRRTTAATTNACCYYWRRKGLLLLFAVACGVSLYYWSQKIVRTEFERPFTTTHSKDATTTKSPPQYRRVVMIRRWQAWKTEGSIIKDNNPATTFPCQKGTVQFDQAPWHGCMVDTNLHMPFCRMEQLRIDLSKITAPMGGEDLQNVMGRQKDEEYPKYQPGSWTISKPLQGVPQRLERSTFHYLQDVLSNVTVVEQGEHQPSSCTETWTGTTLFLTRYEYTNLYHTMTDLFNTFLSYPQDDNDNPQQQQQQRQVHIVFLDSHAKGNLDSVWRHLFGTFTHVQHLQPQGGGVCFEKAVFIPPGYTAPFYPRPLFHAVCPNPIMMEDFGNFVLTSYDNLQHDVPMMQRGKIVIIDRVPYIAHPRSQLAVDQGKRRVVSNMNELIHHLQPLPNVSSVSVVHLEELTFQQQLQVVREAHILIGNHGAGLTHMIFMSDGSHVVEFDNEMPFFTLLSKWKPKLTHHITDSVSGNLTNEYIQGILIPTIQNILR